MAIAITNIGTNTSTSGATVAVTVGAGGVPSGAIIVLGSGEASGSVASGGSVADSGSNSYTSIVSATDNNVTANGFGQVWYSTTGNALVNGNTITYTKATSGSDVALSAVYITGAATSNPLDTAVTKSATGSSTTPSVTSGTPSVAGELFVAFVTQSANKTFTQDTTDGWASPPNSSSTTAAMTINAGSQVNSGTGTIKFAPTYNQSVPWAAFIVGFQPPATFVPYGLAQDLVAPLLAQPDPWTYVFEGGAQPYAPRRLPPSITAVEVDPPPGNTGRLVQAWPADLPPPVLPRNLAPGIPGQSVDPAPLQDLQNAPTGFELSIAGWPDAWTYNFAGGLAPFAPRRLAPSIGAVEVDPPPASHPGRTAVAAELVALAQPDPWTYAFAGSFAPFAPRWLNASITAVEVDPPPFEHEGRFVGIVAEIVATWQPPDPSPYFGAGQGLAPKRLSPGIPGQSVDSPPASHAGRGSVAGELVALGQPDPWTHSFAGGPQAFAPRRLSPQLTAVEVDNPPFPGWRVIVAMPPAALADPLPFVPRPLPQGGSAGAPSQNPVAPAWLPTVLAIWGQADPVAAPAHILNASLAAVEVDSPPFAHPGRTPPIAHELASLAQPDPWACDFTGGAQPYARRPNVSGIPGQSVDPPPPFRNPGLDAVLRPAEPIVVAPARQLSPGIPGQSVDKPPPATLRSIGAAIIATWQPPDPAPIVEGRLSPGIPGQSVDRPPGLAARVGQPLWQDLPPAPLPALPRRFVQGAAAAAANVPFAPAWLPVVLSLWAAEPFRLDEAMRRRLVQAFFAAAAPDPTRLLISPSQRVRLLAGDQPRVRQATSPTARVRQLP